MAIRTSEATVIFLLIGVFLFIVLFIVCSFLVHRRILKRLLNAEKAKSSIEIQHQKNILKTIINAQEAERKRIARLVHDDIGNKINILSVWLNNPDVWNNERSKEIVMNQIPSLATATRNISHELYPVDIENIGFFATLEELAMNVSVSLQVELVAQSVYKEQELATEIQLFRIVQEFVNNVLKHAKARKLTFYMKHLPHSFAIVFADDGVGFDVNSIKKGMGLENIESRIRSLNATFKWKSELGKGTRLIILIPNRHHENTN